MLDKKDAQWWILEAQKHPETAQDLIRLLADRLAFLDKQNEELRGEVIALRRKQRGDGNNANIAALQGRIQELESAIRGGNVEQRLLVYAQNRIEANIPFNTAQQDGLRRELPGDVAVLVCASTAKLLIVTAESRAFNVTLSDLPMPTDSPALLGNPGNVAAIIDQAVFEQCRFLTLLSQKGYVYSQLVGTVNQVARKQEKLIRNLIPDDPIIAAIPSYNADLFAISHRGRWTRFPEKAIAGVGSQVMELPKGDHLVGVVSLAAECDLVFLTADGKLFVRPSSMLTTRRAAGSSSGVLFRNQAILGVITSSQLLILTRRGNILVLQAKELPYNAQTDSGAPVPGLTTDDAADAVLAFTAL